MGEYITSLGSLNARHSVWRYINLVNINLKLVNPSLLWTDITAAMTENTLTQTHAHISWDIFFSIFCWVCERFGFGLSLLWSFQCVAVRFVSFRFVATEIALVVTRILFTRLLNLFISLNKNYMETLKLSFFFWHARFWGPTCCSFICNKCKNCILQTQEKSHFNIACWCR